MRKSLCFSAILATITPMSLSYGAELRVANGLGTPGFGLEVTRSFPQSIEGKLSINRFNFDRPAVPSDGDYQGELQTRSMSASLDWHPFQSNFRLSGGMLYTLTGVDSSGRPARGYVATGDRAYHSAGLAELAAKFNLGNFVPYLGIGWDHLLSTTRGLRFRLDLGITFRAFPAAPLAASGAMEADPPSLQSAADGERDLQDDVDPYEYSPVFSIGSSYAF